MSIEINHMIVPAKDRKASARFLGDILGVEPGPVVIPHFEPLQVGGVTLDFVDSAEVQSMHIAFVVDEATFDAGTAHCRNWARRPSPTRCGASRARSTTASAAGASTSTTPTAISSS